MQHITKVEIITPVSEQRLLFRSTNRFENGICEKDSVKIGSLVIASENFVKRKGPDLHLPENLLVCLMPTERDTLVEIANEVEKLLRGVKVGVVTDVRHQMNSDVVTVSFGLIERTITHEYGNYRVS